MTRLRVVQVFFHADGEPRDPNVVLDEWPTIPAIAAALKQAGVDITTVLASHHDEIVVRDGVEFHFVNDRRGTPGPRIGPVRFRRRPTRIIDRVRSLEPGVIHAHDLQYPIAVGQLARALENVPVLVQDHAVVPPTDWRRIPWRWGLKPVGGAAFTAREQAAPFFQARVFRRDLPLFEILPTSSTFRPGDREDARRATGIFGDPCFLWTTHLDANKDPMTALDAFERVAPRLADPRLWLCFLRAPMLDAIERRIAASPILRERVTLLGARSAEQVEQLMRAADFFLQTSHREASGRSLLEAMSCGLVPLVTDIPAWRRIVGSVGSLTPVGNTTALANAMIEWAGRDPAADRRAVRARFDAALTFEAIGRELRQAYEVLVGTTARRATHSRTGAPR